MDRPDTPAFRSGLAVLVGRTNVGKSTLLNALVDSKISIVSSKPQTTRHPIHGVVHRPVGQIVFVDTPGFFRTRKSQLVDRLHARAKAALHDVDVIVHVVDPTREPGDEDAMVGKAIATLPQPKILCLAKSDLRRRPFRDAWLADTTAYARTLEVSGVTRQNVGALADAILELLPVGPPLYPETDITNASQEFRITEIIREKIYTLTGQEVPYRTAVRLDDTEVVERPTGGPMTHLRATLLVAEERYKAMLIGARGRMIRDIGTAARRDLEPLLGTRVFLELHVKVDAKLPQ